MTVEHSNGRTLVQSRDLDRLFYRTARQPAVSEHGNRKDALSVSSELQPGFI